jgi:hypothetical protein
MLKRAGNKRGCARKKFRRKGTGSTKHVRKDRGFQEI